MQQTGDNVLELLILTNRNMDYKTKKKIESIVESNIKYVPYEGYDISKRSMIDELVNFVDELLEESDYDNSTECNCGQPSCRICN